MNRNYPGNNWQGSPQSGGNPHYGGPDYGGNHYGAQGGRPGYPYGQAPKGRWAGPAMGGISRSRAFRMVMWGVLIILSVMALLRVITIVSYGVGPLLVSLEVLVSGLLWRLITAVIVSVILWLILGVLLGRYLPPAFQREVAPILAVLSLLYCVAPALSTTLGSLILMILGIVLLLRILVR